MLLICTLILSTVFTALEPQTAWADRWSFAGTNARYLLPGSYLFAQPITLPDGRLLAVDGGSTQPSLECMCTTPPAIPGRRRRRRAISAR